MHCLIGEKIGMTRIFDEEGKVSAVTVIRTGKNIVHQIKTKEKDGYNAVQLGFFEIDEKKVSLPVLGHFKKLGTPVTKVIKEMKLSDGEDGLQVGQKLGVEVFENVKYVDIIGISKGRGHAGTIKRYNFKRGRESHGNTNVREHGSVGANTYPARVFPGMKMSGHYGAERVTIKRLKVVKIDKENDLIFVNGGVPGKNKGIVMVRENRSA